MAIALKAARGEIKAVGNPPVYRHEMEHAIERVTALIHGRMPYNERWAAVTLLLYGPGAIPGSPSDALDGEGRRRLDDIRRKLEEIEGATVRNIVTTGRYGYASGAVTECLLTAERPRRTMTERIDAIVAHRVFGFPVFLAILWLMFQATFRLGNIPMEWIGMFFDGLGGFATAVLPPGIPRSLIVDGIIAGVGGVLVFMPNIMLLFLFIAILEDTGYMARAAFIMDRVMHCFGLHGKAFIPMIVGFGCTVPAIMATRILENRRDRMVTMFILPFMSCGARLPVYILLAGAFFSPETAGNVIFSLYIAGAVLSLVVARILTAFQGTCTPFVMELPPYRIPTARSVLLHIWERSAMYLRKAGTTILMFSVIVWILVTFPRADHAPPHAGDLPRDHDIERTYAGRFGTFIEPVIKPLGFDWRVGVALTRDSPPRRSSYPLSARSIRSIRSYPNGQWAPCRKPCGATHRSIR